MPKETQEKLHKTIELLCEDVQTCVNIGIKNGGHVVGFPNLPDLLNSIANLVNASRF
jgi:hypothetical protein